MAAFNALSYLQTLLDQGQFKNNPLAGYRPPAASLDPNVQSLVARMLQEPAAQQVPPGIPPGLPDAVVRSIQGAPTYREGQTIPNPRIPPSEMGPGGMPLDSHEREQLNRQLWAMREWPNQNLPLSEGQFAAPILPQPRYPSPLNQFMGRLPGMGLY